MEEFPLSVGAIAECGKGIIKETIVASTLADCGITKSGSDGRSTLLYCYLLLRGREKPCSVYIITKSQKLKHKRLLKKNSELF